VYVCVCVYVCEYACCDIVSVCVFVNMREKERERESVCVCDTECVADFGKQNEVIIFWSVFPTLEANVFY